MIQSLPQLHKGVSVAEVGNWQRFLNRVGITDNVNATLMVDEQFGARTEYATSSYQASRSLRSTGIVDADTRRTAIAEGFIPFIQARGVNYVSSRSIRLIVLHTMENDEKPDKAEGVALWFAGMTKYEAPQASAHYNIDTDSIVQSVRERDIAWGAPGANNDGIHIEHAGRAGQSFTDWFDATSIAILARSSVLVADLCLRHDIPVRKLVKGEILAGEKGICGHADISAAYPPKTNPHLDPGPNFPWQDYLKRVLKSLDQHPTTRSLP